MLPGGSLTGNNVLNGLNIFYINNYLPEWVFMGMQG